MTTLRVVPSRFPLTVSAATLSLSMMFYFMVEQEIGVIYVGLFLCFLVIFAWPLQVAQRSELVDRDTTKIILDRIGWSGAINVKIRKKSYGQPAAFDCFFLRFILISEEDISSIVNLKKLGHPHARVAHEVAHALCRDPLTFSLHLSFSFFSVVLLLASAYHINTDIKYSDLGSVSLHSSQARILFGVVLSFVAVPIFACWSFLHTREFSADFLSQSVQKENYAEFLQMNYGIERLSKPKTPIHGVWNKLTHPSFKRRLGRIKESKDYRYLLPSIALIQSYFIAVSLITVFVIRFDVLSVWRWWATVENPYPPFMVRLVYSNDSIVVIFAVFLFSLFHNFTAWCHVPSKRPLALSILLMSCALIYIVNKWFLGLFIESLNGQYWAQFHWIAPTKPFFDFLDLDSSYYALIVLGIPFVIIVHSTLSFIIVSLIIVSKKFYRRIQNGS